MTDHTQTKSKEIKMSSGYSFPTVLWSSTQERGVATMGRGIEGFVGPIQI